MLALDNLVASLAVGSAAYAGQGLATPHGRAQAQLAALAAVRQARAWVGEVVRGGSAPSGGVGGGGRGAGSTSAPLFTGAAAFVGASGAGDHEDAVGGAGAAPGGGAPPSPHV